MTDGYRLHFRVLPSEPRCTCTTERDSDGAEMGMCPVCEDLEYNERHGDPAMLDNLHGGAFDVCPRAACLSEDIEVGPGNTARCNVCGVRW